MCHLRVTVSLTSDLVFRLILSRAYLVYLKVGIPNLVGGCNFRWRSVTYHFWVTLTLSSDPVCRIILYYSRLESQIWCLDASWDGGVCVPFMGHSDLKLDI